MIYYVFTNYGYANEGCFIETPSEADSIENFKFACEVSKLGTIVELAYFAESGEFICLDRYEVD